MNISLELLKIKAVFLRPNEPFIWASGIKSPIYCDNRLTLGYPKLRKDIALELSNIIKSKYQDIDLIVGTATAGIPHATLISDILNKPLGYVRSSNKNHGRQNQFEGNLIKGNVIVVEDLISTGKSSLEVCDCLKELGFNVLGVISIFSYELESGINNFRNNDIEYDSLSNFYELIKIALKNNYINKEEYNKLLKWHINPNDESWIKY